MELHVFTLTLFFAVLFTQSYGLVLTVSKHGKGNYTTISAAVDAAPNTSSTQITILIIGGKYKEQVLIPKWKTNLFLKGEGASSTIIYNYIHATPGGKRTDETATVGVDADGFMAEDIKIANLAGPAAGQAIAFRSQGDKTVLHRCVLEGYQDTLFTQAGRHFFRDSQFYGTVDFVFGRDSRAVFQNCEFFFRIPLQGQPDVLTAQGRETKEPSGIVLHNCRLSPDPQSVEPANGAYLGRPWGKYSRTVIMESYLDIVVNITGWMPWEHDYASLSDASYLEYKNRGPRQGPEGRIDPKWCPGCRVVTDRQEVFQFTVRNFIQGPDWIPTGVPYSPDLLS